MNTFSWPIGHNETLTFTIYGANQYWERTPCLYIFAYQNPDKIWVPLYVGQTDDFSASLTSHEKLDMAMLLGATHIHARVVPFKTSRDAFELALIRNLKPIMNAQILEQIQVQKGPEVF
jgi:hypothetical protein